MTGAADCPKCGLTNPPGALRCDCGWDFEASAFRRPYAPRARRDPAPLNWVGCLGTFFGTLGLVGLAAAGWLALMGTRAERSPVIGLFAAAWVWTVPTALVLRRRWPDLALGVAVGGGLLALAAIPAFVWPFL